MKWTEVIALKIYDSQRSSDGKCWKSSGTKPFRASKQQINKFFNELILVNKGQFLGNSFPVIGARKEPSDCMLFHLQGKLR